MFKVGIGILIGASVGGALVWRLTDPTRRELAALKQAREEDDLFAVDLLDDLQPAFADIARRREERLIGRIIPRRKRDDGEEQS